MDGILGIVIGIIIALIIIGTIAIFIYDCRKNKQDTLEFLEGLVKTLYKKIISLIKSDERIYKSDPLDVVEEKLLRVIHESCWEYIHTYAKTAQDQNQITEVMLSILTRDFVDKFVSGIIERFDIKSTIEDEWRKNQIDDDFVSRVEAEDKALQEKFSDPELYNIEEIDKYNDLERADTGVAYTTTEDGIVEEIQRPNDVEDLELDTENDESVEVIGEDGLTKSEREAGIHFNKNGRKIDKRGRFVKK